MKKYISIAFAAVAMCFGVAGCSVETDEEPGGTNIEKMAGRWEVTVSVVDQAGNTLAELDDMDALMTYNTADNSTDKMWITDSNDFRAFTMKVDIDYKARTFSCNQVDYDAKGTGQATITNGKILEGAAKNLHGMPNDSIVFDITFSDDEEPGTIYRIAGQRYTGFYE